MFDADVAGVDTVADADADAGVLQWLFSGFSTCRPMPRVISGKSQRES